MNKMNQKNLDDQAHHANSILEEQIKTNSFKNQKCFLVMKNKDFFNIRFDSPSGDDADVSPAKYERKIFIISS